APRSSLSAGIRGPRARALVLQGPGIVRRQRQEVGGAPSQVAHLQPEQLGVLVLPRGDVDRPWEETRSACDAGEAAGRSGRPRLGSGGSGLQKPGPKTS